MGLLPFSPSKKFFWNFIYRPLTCEENCFENVFERNIWLQFMWKNLPTHVCNPCSAAMLLRSAEKRDWTFEMKILHIVSNQWNINFPWTKERGKKIKSSSRTFYFHAADWPGWRYVCCNLLVIQKNTFVPFSVTNLLLLLTCNFAFFC